MALIKKEKMQPHFFPRFSFLSSCIAANSRTNTESENVDERLFEEMQLAQNRFLLAIFAFLQAHYSRLQNYDYYELATGAMLS